MIPLQLTLEGLYSYQQRQTVDFTRLTSAAIFGIFGSVGSGKSSILEAITFALYGRTDRLNLAGDNRNYNMMNLKSDELYIEFIFKTGKPEQEYMACVRGRRNSKRFEDVKALDRTAYLKNGNDWIPVEPEKLEEVIGLSYENFKRTIIIPQGKFQEFLQLGRAERTQMMKELFNLGRFELFFKVTPLESRNNERMQHLQGQLQQLGEINPDEIRQNEEKLATLQKETATLSKKLGTQREQNSAWEKLRELFEKLKKESENLSVLQAQKEGYDQLAAGIREFEHCLMMFKPLLETKKETVARIGSLKKEIFSDQEKYKKLEDTLAKLSQEYEQVRPAYQQREQLRQQADELKKMLRIRELAEETENLQGRIEKGETYIKDYQSKIKETKENLNGYSTQLREMKNQRPDMSLLSKAREWHTEQNRLIKLIADEEKEIQLLEQASEKIQHEISNLHHQKEFQSLSWPDDPAELLNVLNHHTEALKKQGAELTQRMNEHTVQLRLQEYATSLEDGKPCPLCGSESHPMVLDVQDVSAHLNQLKDEESRLQDRQKLTEKITRKVSELGTTLRLNRENLQKETEKLSRIKTEAGALQQQFTWKESWKEEKKVAEAFEHAEKLNHQIQELEEKAEKEQKQAEEKEKNLKKYEESITGFQQQMTARQAEQSTLEKQLTLVKPDDYVGKENAQVEKEAGTLLERYNKLEATFNSLQQSIETTGREKDLLAGRLEANKKTLEKEQAALLSLEHKLKQLLQDSNYKNQEEVEAILNRTTNLEADKKRLETWKQQVASAQERVNGLKQETAGKEYDPDSHKKINEEITAGESVLSEKMQAQGTLTSLIARQQKDMERAGELKKELEVAQLRAEDLKTLKQLFKGSGFVNYISSVHLQNLCNAANDRFFKLTRQKLSLEITDDNTFQVRDFMNGGKTRNIKTLSGGQTFQAALSLALALADSIQQMTASDENFFFLDEGFGSLDKESLDIVFDTIKSLRKENRIVGVISHVEEMQQEIDTHLRIVNDTEQGSRIMRSWEV